MNGYKCFYKWFSTSIGCITHEKWYELLNVIEFIKFKKHACDLKIYKSMFLLLYIYHEFSYSLTLSVHFKEKSWNSNKC